MIGLLKRFVEWAEKRWPEKVVVTKAEYDVLKAGVDGLLLTVNEKRIKQMEDEIAKFNVAFGFGAQRGMSGVQPFQR